jgi:pyruvate, water dikinase
MCDIPSNAILAEDFLRIFDGFSIGSNHLTQLTLGLDRDSATVAHLFDERDPAVRWLISRAIHAARRLGKPIGICGQAPSDYPEFAAWLVREGIDSIALNPDVAIATAVRVAAVEQTASASTSSDPSSLRLDTADADDAVSSLHARAEGVRTRPEVGFPVTEST